MPVELRNYQVSRLVQIKEAMRNANSVLCSMPTGVGKTVVAARLVADWPAICGQYNRDERVLWLAHRGELIWQACQAIEAATGETPAVEKAESRSVGDDGLFHERVVVASVQTLFQQHRIEQWNRDYFGLLVGDEGHHYVADSFNDVIGYFSSAKSLFLTATVDRTDEVSLGRICEAAVEEYSILDAIKDGWLCPILQQFVEVEGLDWSEVRSSGNDLSAEDIGRVIQEESILHKIVAPAVQMAGDRATIFYCPTVMTAKAVAAIIPRYSKGGVACVFGSTDPIERDQIVRSYIRREFQWLVNVMCMTEGFDAPHVSCIVLARPTKSRLLYTQCLGRALRGGPRCPVEGKQNALIIDLVGASLRHKLVHTCEALGGRYDAVVVEEATRRCHEQTKAGQDADSLKILMECAAMSEQLRHRQRMEIIAKAKLKRKTIDPFVLLDMPDAEVPGWVHDRPPTAEQLKVLDGHGIKTAGLTHAEAKQLVDEVFRRRAVGECTPKQARILTSFGHDPHLSYSDASRIIDGIARRGWKHTKSEAIRFKKSRKGD